MLYCYSSAAVVGGRHTMVTPALREAILARDRWCLLFHSRPVRASDVAPAGEPSGGEAQAYISVCADCLRKVTGPGVPYRIVRFSPHELEVIDPESRRVPHDELFFYRVIRARQAATALSRAIEAVGRLRSAEWDLCRHLTELAADDLWSLIDTGDDATPSSLYDLVSLHLGLTASDVRRMLRVWRWAEGSGLEPGNPSAPIRSLAVELADAVRRLDGEGELAPYAGAMPIRALFDELDRLQQGRKRLRSFVLTSGPVRLVRARGPEEVDRQPGEKLIRGSLLTGGDDVEAGDD